MNREKKIETIFNSLVGIGLKPEARDTIKNVLTSSSDTDLSDMAVIIAEYVKFRRDNLNMLKNRIHKLSIGYEEKMDNLVEQASL